MGAGENKDRPLRVGLDGFNLGLEQGTGIATYARNLSYALKDLGAHVDVIYGRNLPNRSERGDGYSARLLREVTFFDPKPTLQIRSVPQALFHAVQSLAPPKVTEVPLSGSVVTDHFRERLPAFDRLFNARNLFVMGQNHFAVWGKPLRIRLADPPAVMHWSYPLPIEIVGSKNIYTVHDLVPLRLPHTTTDHKKRFLRMVRWVAENAHHIITVSETSRTDIIDILGVDPSRVTNTFQTAEFSSYDTDISGAEAQMEVRGAVGLPHQSYFLFFGAIEPKKNVARLIEGFLAANVSAPLLIVGKKAWKSRQELKLLPLGSRRHVPEPGSEAPDLQDGGGPRVIQLDYAPQSLLVSLIKGARGVLFPSVYEGFGLPVLEAMQLGTPVITSKTSSLPEVVGDAALLVDPYDPRSIAEAIRRLDSDAGLRAELAARGLQRAKLFSPHVYRKRLGDLYNHLGLAV